MQLGDIANARGGPAWQAARRVRSWPPSRSAVPPLRHPVPRPAGWTGQVEHPGRGGGPGVSTPHMLDPDGRTVGATPAQQPRQAQRGPRPEDPEGRDCSPPSPRFDVVCENFKAGTTDRLGLGYDAIAARHPTRCTSRCRASATPANALPLWPAYAAIVEGMSGIYEYRPTGRPPGQPGGRAGRHQLGAVRDGGVLAALRHRDRTGEGQHVDVAMLDAVVAMTDIVTNLWSMGCTPGRGRDQGHRRHVRRRRRLLRLQGVRPQHHGAGRGHRPAGVERRAPFRRPRRLDRASGRSGPPSRRGRRPQDQAGGGAGLSARPGRRPSYSAAEVIADHHVAASGHAGGDPPADGVAQPILIPGNPVKMSDMAEGPEARVPWLGEHTGAVLADELGWTTPSWSGCGRRG